jgi:7-keto-8-aminopelargonate synthetase-like enzyme
MPNWSGPSPSSLGKEDCLVFSTGYSANLGLITGLVTRGDVVYLDKLDHASIVDGAKMSYGETERFNHGDLGNLTRKLERNMAKGVCGSLIIVDGVFSMEGNIADVPGLVKVARRYGAALALDDAHSIGVLGPKGDGTAAHFGMIDDVDIIAGTFSKSLASIGGFVAGTESVIHYLRHHSRPLIFTAALPPSNTAGVLAALEVMQQEPERRVTLWANTKRLHDGMRAMGFEIGPTQTPIVPVLIGPLEEDPGDVAQVVRRRDLHQSGDGARGADHPVPAPHQPDGDAQLRSDRLLHRNLRQDWTGAGGYLTQATIRAVGNDARALKRFIDLPYRLHARDPIWVPPLRRDVKLLLDKQKNPFFEHAEAEYFLAEQDGEVVGRIAAISKPAAQRVSR